MCGGTISADHDDDPPEGLSPRVRGNHRARPCRRTTRGSIPACAGEPLKSNRGQAALEVYPRVCGGTPVRRRLRPPGRGLSPRVRGNPVRVSEMKALIRSIPACAGEPVVRCPGDGVPGVYPRVCGGTCGCPVFSTDGIGLSPRVRGNRHGVGTTRRTRRSIPACAGEPR